MDWSEVSKLGCVWWQFRLYCYWWRFSRRIDCSTKEANFKKKKTRRQLQQTSTWVSFSSGIIPISGEIWNIREYLGRQRSVRSVYCSGTQIGNSRWVTSSLCQLRHDSIKYLHSFQCAYQVFFETGTNQLKWVYTSFLYALVEVFTISIHFFIFPSSKYEMETRSLSFTLTCM